MADQTYTPSWKAAGAIGDSSNSTTVAPAYPTGGNAPVAGDIAIAVINKDSNTTISAPDGTWSEIATKEYSTTFRLSVFWKRMSGGESGTVTFTFGAAGGANNNGSGTIHLFQNCQVSGTPYEGLGTSTSGPNSDSQTIPSVTFTAGPRLLVVIDALGDDHTGSPPGTGGYSEWADITSSAGADSQHHIWGKTLGTGGGTDSPGNCTHTGASGDPWAAIAFALKGYTNIDVTAAAPTISGSSVLSDESSAVTQASLSVTGTTLTIERVASIAELSVTGQDVALDKSSGGSIDFPFDQAALSTSGSTLTSDESSAVTEASLSSSGQSVDLSLGINCAVDSASVSTVGQDIVGDEAVVFTQASLSTEGVSVVGDISLLVTTAEPTLSGSDVSFSLGLNCAVDCASLTVTGQDVTLYPSYSIEVTEASITAAGQTVALDLGGSIDMPVDPATASISGSTLSFDSALNLSHAALSISETSVSLDKVFGFTEATFSSQGQEVSLDVLAGLSITVDSAALSVDGTALTIDRVSDPASLTTQGQDVGMDWSAGTNINFVFDQVSFSTTGTTLTIERVANAGSIDIQPSWVELENSMGQPTYTLDVVPVTFSIGTQWVQTEQSKEHDEARFSATGSNVTWGYGILVTEAALSASGSAVDFILYNSTSIDVTPAQPVITGQDVVFQTTQTPIPDLQVENATLVVQGVNVVLERPPLDVVAASLEITGKDVLLTPLGMGNVLPVTGAALTVSGQNVTQVLEGSFTLNVTPVVLTLEGKIVGLVKDVIDNNLGRIDGSDEFIISQQHQGILLYPARGGYYVISS